MESDAKTPLTVDTWTGLEEGQQNIRSADEFSSCLISEQKVHASTALLKSGQYLEAMKCAQEVFAYEPKTWSSLRANINLAMASARLGQWDAVEAYTDRSFLSIDRPPELDLRELLDDLKRHRNPRAARLREFVESKMRSDIT